MREEFCDGVKILLKRMESNPEEFKGSDNKWNSLIPKGSGGYIDWSHALTEEESKALAEGMRKIYRTVYTEKVMATLLYSTEETVQDPYTVKGVPPGTWINVTSKGGGGSIGNVSPAQNAYNPYQATNTTGTLYAQQTMDELRQMKIEQEAKKLGLGEVLRRKIAKL